MNNRILCLLLAAVLALSVSILGCTSEYVPEMAGYYLTISATKGGLVIAPGQGTGSFTYQKGEVVDLVATADEGYHFVKWTGDVGTIDNVNAAITTITMNGNYEITASFGLIPPVRHTLTIASTEGGSVTAPGEGTFTYDAGTVVYLVTTPARGYCFVNWTGDVSSFGNVNAPAISVTMSGNYSITASFGECSALQVFDDFSEDSGYWTYVSVVTCDMDGGEHPGAAYRDIGKEYLVLTPPINHQCGVVWLTNEVYEPFTAWFRYRAGGGTGADGFVFMFYKDKAYVPVDAAWLGFNKLPLTTPVSGYGVEFDSFNNGFDGGTGHFEDPPDPHIALIKDSVGNHLVYRNDYRTKDDRWHDATVIVGDSTISVYVDGDLIFSWEGTIDRTYGGLGFGAGTGGATNWHIIDDVRITLGT